MRPDVAFGPEPAGALRVMRTIVVGPVPIEMEALLARRRALGLDLYDEVGEGEYHVSPAAHAGHGELDQQLAVLLSTPARRAGLVGLGRASGALARGQGRRANQTRDRPAAASSRARPAPMNHSVTSTSSVSEPTELPRSA